MQRALRAAQAATHAGTAGTERDEHIARERDIATRAVRFQVSAGALRRSETEEEYAARMEWRHENRGVPEAQRSYYNLKDPAFVKNYSQRYVERKVARIFRHADNRGMSVRAYVQAKYDERIEQLPDGLKKAFRDWSRVLKDIDRRMTGEPSSTDVFWVNDLNQLAREFSNDSWTPRWDLNHINAIEFSQEDRQRFLHVRQTMAGIMSTTLRHKNWKPVQVQIFSACLQELESLLGPRTVDSGVDASSTDDARSVYSSSSSDTSASMSSYRSTVDTEFYFADASAPPSVADDAASTFSAPPGADSDGYSGSTSSGSSTAESEFLAIPHRGHAGDFREASASHAGIMARVEPGVPSDENVSSIGSSVHFESMPVEDRSYAGRPRGSSRLSVNPDPIRNVASQQVHRGAAEIEPMWLHHYRRPPSRSQRIRDLFRLGFEVIRNELHGKSEKRRKKSN